ncbi:MAG: hypothetical protein COA45_01285 [Zetaproteobacteria bacterium]|nr:MAG: hypothetical protein COA45_01285 [Zetaproteobacteria bacterium]
MCNPFTDTDVRAHLDATGESARVKDVYAACSGGADINCGTCVGELKTMVDKHNNALTIGQLSDQMQKATHKNKETV